MSKKSSTFARFFYEKADRCHEVAMTDSASVVIV